jgi:hypothetical protein
MNCHPVTKSGIKSLPGVIDWRCVVSSPPVINEGLFAVIKSAPNADKPKWVVISSLRVVFNPPPDVINSLCDNPPPVAPAQT